MFLFQLPRNFLSMPRKDKKQNKTVHLGRVTPGAGVRLTRGFRAFTSFSAGNKQQVCTEMKDTR